MLVLLLLLLFLAGCGKKECKTDAVCDDDNACTTDRCMRESWTCKHTLIPNCNIGNGKCEPDKGETKCNAPQDCGQCFGKQGEYLSMSCDDKNNCVLQMDESMVRVQELTDKINLRNIELAATYSYEQPFNVDKSLFHVDIVLESIMSGTQQPTINKVQVIEKLDKRGQDVKVYGEKIVDRVLWNKNSPLRIDVPLVNAEENLTDALKKLTVILFYEYTTVKSGKESITPGTYNKDLSSEILLVNPSENRECPESCDDNNPCSTDTCSARTNYFCEHTLTRQACCGNNVCDSNENKCTCLDDCGLCQGSGGLYTEYICYNDECVTQLKDSDAIQPTTVVNEKDITGFRISLQTTYDGPFHLTNSRFNLVFELMNIKSELYTGLKITKIQALDGNELLGELDLSQGLTAVGSSFSVPFRLDFALRGAEEEKNIGLKIYYEYTKLPSTETGTAQTLRSSYTQSYGKITVINNIL